ncbi:MAG TPA: Ig-like domain-containing protein [Bacteroidales bacterium]|nr:Ig-like domain-containing protein [Bacteroidales bacterium]HPS73715.1 Ig-like domain-containing protein [Bacteroidales bacterium]
MILRKHDSYLVLLFIPLIFFLTQCANVGSPEGGKKDIIPPAVTTCNPPNHSTHFKGKNIYIEFDEFVNAETSGDKILISPPVDKAPDYRLRGKTLIVSFDDSLHPNTTYSIDFGKSITDITENNVLPDFRYAFSTGDVLDSLSVTGAVTDAFTTLPVKDVLVMLYPSQNDTIPADSMPVRMKPFFMTRTGEDGRFSLTNLAPGMYRIFALSDKTGDLLYNTLGESIAFADFLISPWYEKPVTVDTSSRPDSTLPAPVTPSPVKLRMYEPKDSTVTLDKAFLSRDRMASLVFSFAPKQLHIVPLNVDSLTRCFLMEPNAAGDTVTLWFTGDLPDSLSFRITADKMTPDTISLPVMKPSLGKKPKKEEVQKGFDISPNTRGGVLNYFKYALVLTSAIPMKTANLGAIRLIDGNDTLSPVSAIDSIKRRITIEHKWIEGKTYQVFIPDSALINVNGAANDTLRIPVKATELKNYANLTLNVGIPSDTPRVIVQLLSEDEKVVEEQMINKTGRISFNYLLPAKYKIKAILDLNMNNRWDSGDYFRHIQPEAVSYFPRTLELRANWDVEETWELLTID